MTDTIDTYLAFHRFPEKKRECEKCIVDKIFAAVREQQQGGSSG